MELKTNYFILSFSINILGIILLVVWERIVRHKNRVIIKQRSYIIGQDKYSLSQQSYIKQLEKSIEKSDLTIKMLKDTIKFLSEQNIVLNNELGNIEKNYSENSDSIKADKLKKGNEKFIQILQTSK